MAYRLGVDVGGTFTDLILLRESDGAVFTAKVPSTPDDPSRAVFEGIDKICRRSQVDRRAITHVMHGTTVATNAVLTGNGARVGFVTTKGYRQMLHIGRSFVPGGLGGWVIFQKSRPLPPLKWTIEADERIGAHGEIVTPFDEAALRRAVPTFREANVEAITVALLNAFANSAHEQRIRENLVTELPGIPVSISSEVIPEMQEYERAITTVVNSYVRPVVGRYIDNLQAELERTMDGVKLGILKSDGGLAASRAAANYPVNLLMSGPAGGVSGAIWAASQAGFPNIMTFDMGGTSTDVALIENGAAQLRRETRVGDVVVRASSVDVRTVGAGGGSIARVPELTGALRVGPQSAGAVPGPAAYGKGGEAPTVTDANIVLGYLPAHALLGGDMQLDRPCAERAVQIIADAMALSLEEAAAGIIDIVNENMFGALRLISVEQGYDPRDFALMASGGAGPLYANALARLTGAWPAIIPRGPGVLCAYGDATTRMRNEASRTFIRRFSDVTVEELRAILTELAAKADEKILAAKIDNILVAPGDYLVFETWGSGGLGLPFERDLAAIEYDLESRLMTAAGALRFGVALNADGLTIDHAATATLRARLAADQTPPPLFNFGATVAELRARCTQETGLRRRAEARATPATADHERGRESGRSPLRREARRHEFHPRADS